MGCSDRERVVNIILSLIIQLALQHLTSMVWPTGIFYIITMRWWWWWWSGSEESIKAMAGEGAVEVLWDSMTSNAIMP
jgi:hypothetical protein